MKQRAIEVGSRQPCGICFARVCFDELLMSRALRIIEGAPNRCIASGLDRGKIGFKSIIMVNIVFAIPLFFQVS